MPDTSAAFPPTIDSDSPSRARTRAPRSAPKPLSQKEAADLKEQLIEILAGLFEDTDKLLTVTSATKKQANIWSSIDDQEIEIIADAWVSWGRKSARGAAVVRRVVREWRKYQVALILGPRFVETIGFVAENGLAVPTPAWRKPRASKTKPQPQAQRVPIVDSTIVPTPAPAPVAASVPPAQPQAAQSAPVNPYAAAEAAQRANAARVHAMQSLAAEAASDPMEAMPNGA